MKHILIFLYVLLSNAFQRHRTVSFSQIRNKYSKLYTQSPLNPPTGLEVPTSLNSIHSPNIAPLKVMIFVDGTWLYYSMFERGDRCSIKKLMGDDWKRSHRIDWKRLPQIVGKEIDRQLQSQSCSPRFVDVVRTSVFTSMKADTLREGMRYRMVEDFHACNFQVLRLITEGEGEKCVDISLAVEMVSMAYVPNVFDIAVIVSGDKDFLPALQKTRLAGKRVAICSMRNGCNRHLIKAEASSRDFDVIWLDDYLDELITPRFSQDAGANDIAVVEIIKKLVEESEEGFVLSRQVGACLKCVESEGSNLLDILKLRHGSLRLFLNERQSVFRLEFDPSIDPEYIITLRSEADDDMDIELEGGSEDQARAHFSQEQDLVTHAASSDSNRLEEEVRGFAANQLSHSRNEMSSGSSSSYSIISNSNTNSISNSNTNSISSSVVEEEEEVAMQILTESELQSMTTKDLKDLLKAAGQKQAGLKGELVDRALLLQAEYQAKISSRAVREAERLKHQYEQQRETMERDKLKTSSSSASFSASASDTVGDFAHTQDRLSEDSSRAWNDMKAAASAMAARYRPTDPADGGHKRMPGSSPSSSMFVPPPFSMTLSSSGSRRLPDRGGFGAGKETQSRAGTSVPPRGPIPVPTREQIAQDQQMEDLVKDILLRSNKGEMSSRDVGRAMVQVPVGNSGETALDLIKSGGRSLRAFLVSRNIFNLESLEPTPECREFMVSLREKRE